MGNYETPRKERAMEIGLHLPHTGPNASREVVKGFAQTAEALGFDSLWVSDHVVLPREIKSRYPYRPSGRFPVPTDWPFLEPLATLTFVAGCTERVRLGTTVLVLPMRNPVLTAKLLATLDVLSGGRLILGAGVGWLAEEFRLLDAPFAQRGARTDEYLRLMKALWTEESPRFQGAFYQLDGVAFYPKPVQKPHPPIWVGGGSEAALRRAGELGDAWHVVGAESDLARKFRRVQEYAEASGRDPATVALTVRIGLHPDKLDEAQQRLLSYQAMGADHVVVEFRVDSLPEAEATMRRFAQEVRPALAD